MLNNEVKEILQEQFSKERNYQKVMNNVNKKQISYSKILKYALLPTCAVILVAILIPHMNNNNNEYKEIAQGNIIEKDYENAIVEITDNNEVIETPVIEERPTTQIDLDKDNQNKDNKTSEDEKNKDNTAQIQIAKGEIYKTIHGGGESSWAYDPTIPENIINDATTSKYVVRVKIVSVGEGKMLPKQENFYNPFTCYTPIKMRIVDNLISTNKLSETITAYITGGKIKISNILRKATKQEIEYMGIYDVSQVDKEKYIEYIWSDPYYEPKVGDEYVIIIGKANANLYQICCGGYGIFKVEKSNDQEKYINVVTNKEWKIK